MTIVTTHYRYKRPPKKRQSVALTGSAIVRKQSSADVLPPDRVGDRSRTKMIEMPIRPRLPAPEGRVTSSSTYTKYALGRDR